MAAKKPQNQQSQQSTQFCLHVVVYIVIKAGRLQMDCVSKKHCKLKAEFKLHDFQSLQITVLFTPHDYLGSIQSLHNRVTHCMTLHLEELTTTLSGQQTALHNQTHVRSDKAKARPDWNCN